VLSRLRRSFASHSLLRSNRSPLQRSPARSKTDTATLTERCVQRTPNSAVVRTHPGAIDFRDAGCGAAHRVS
jgi:hypothetical protein